MSSLFGGGDDSASQEMLQMQKDEAAEARKKEADRKARINSGLARINAMFSPQGEEQRVNRTFDWKTFNPATAKAGAVPGMPGFNFVDLPAVAGVAGRAATPTSMVGTPSGHGGNTQVTTTPGQAAVAAVPGRDAGMYIKGPDGKIYKQGDVVSGNVGTGKFTGGFGDDFYNKFKAGVTSYYLPQVAEKYGDAKDETTYRLARAGTLKSTMANELAADLAKQNAIQIGNVRSKADSGAADLLGRVNAAKTNAVNQLYSTENPDVAINQATGAIRNITPAPTDLSPLADIFNVATIGAAKGIQGYNDQKFIAANQDIFGKSGSGRIVPS